MVVWPSHDPGLAIVKGAQPRTVWTGNWLQVWHHLNVCKKKRDIKENPAPPGVKCLLIVNNVVLIWLVMGGCLEEFRPGVLWNFKPRGMYSHGRLSAAEGFPLT